MKKSNEHKLLSKANDISSLYGIKSYTINDGRARGVRAFDLDNGGGLNATVFGDRCLDIARINFKGVNAGVLLNSGFSSPFSFAENGGIGFLRQFYGGFMTTCGITYSGAPSTENGTEFGLHGVISNTTAENVCAQRVYDGDDAVLKISGSVREAMLFGPNMRLNRELVMQTEANVIELHDTIENLGFETSPLMMLYHVNLGYPLLDAGARCYFSTDSFYPFDDEAKKGVDKYNVIEEPLPGKPEQCYIHTGCTGSPDSFAMLVNSDLGMAAIIHYNSEQCPFFIQWKSMCSGNYALGMEPGTCTPGGRAAARESGMPVLAPGESYNVDIRFEFTDDSKVIEHYRSLCKENSLSL